MVKFSAVRRHYQKAYMHQKSEDRSLMVMAVIPPKRLQDVGKVKKINI